MECDIDDRLTDYDDNYPKDDDDDDRGWITGGN